MTTAMYNMSAPPNPPPTWHQRQINSWMEAEGKARGLNACLGWVYMLEMLLKILVFGWNGKGYSEPRFRCPLPRLPPRSIYRSSGCVTVLEVQ